MALQFLLTLARLLAFGAKYSGGLGGGFGDGGCLYKGVKSVEYRLTISEENYHVTCQWP